MTQQTSYRFCFRIIMPEDIGTPFGPCHVYGYIPMDDEAEEKKSRISEALWHLGCIEALKKSEINKKRYGIRRFDAG